MEMLLFLSLSTLWVVVLGNLILTLRILRWIRATQEARLLQAPVKSSELVIGAPAPEFKARTLTGQAVRLDTYLGHPVAFLFVSPVCGHCRMEIPKLLKLAALAKKNADVEFILVSDWGPLRTQEWLDIIRLEDGVDVTLPVLVAPRGKSDFLDDYNPKQAIPGFCLLDAQGTVQATGPISSTEWNTFKRTWEGVSRLSPLMFSKYQ